MFHVLLCQTLIIFKQFFIIASWVIAIYLKRTGFLEIKLNVINTINKFNKVGGMDHNIKDQVS